MKFPEQFEEPFREDLIIRAVLALRSQRTPYGANVRAGKETSAKLSRRRRAYRGAYGKGINRMPRKTMTARGSQMHWVGALAPHARGGMRAHPAKAAKQWEQKINNKERKKAIRSALGATIDKKRVEQRGHQLPKEYPLVVEASFEKIKKTADVKKELVKLGLEKELKRLHPRRRAGRGNMRGRPTRQPKGPLFVVSTTCELNKAAKNMPGIEVVDVHNLNASNLAPGTHAGRLVIYTKPALEVMKKERLFL